MTFSRIKNIALAALILFFIFQQVQKQKNAGKIISVDGKKYELVKHTIDTVEVIKTKVVTKRGRNIYHERIKEVRIPAKIDTLAVIRAYYSKNIYKDTLYLPDNLGTVSLIDTISKNRIQGRTFSAKVKQRIVTETTIVKELPRTQLYYGISGGFNKTDILSNVAAGFLLKTKSDQIYQLGIGVSNTVGTTPNSKLTPYIGAGAYWKIKIKK